MKYKVHTTHVVERDYEVSFELPEGVSEEIGDRIVRDMLKSGALQEQLPNHATEETVSKELIRKVERIDGTKVHPRVRKVKDKVWQEKLPLTELGDE